jgi:hypothetical protein
MIDGTNPEQERSRSIIKRQAAGMHENDGNPFAALLTGGNGVRNCPSFL